MAFQRGVLKLEGRIDELTFFQSWYGYAARKKTGVSGDRIKNDPVFARAQENMSEFGRSGKATKLIRNAFKVQITDVADLRFTQRLVQTTMAIVKSDNVNDRGQRVLVNGDLSQLLKLEFNAEAHLGYSFQAPYTSAIHRESGSLTVDVPAFVPAAKVNKPEGATHFRLIAAAAGLDFSLEERVSHTDLSPLIAIGEQKETIKLVCQLPPASANTLLLALGIQYWQEINGAHYPLKDKKYSAMKFIQIDGKPMTA